MVTRKQRKELGLPPLPPVPRAPKRAWTDEEIERLAYLLIGHRVSLGCAAFILGRLRASCSAMTNSERWRAFLEREKLGVWTNLGPRAPKHLRLHQNRANVAALRTYLTPAAWRELEEVCKAPPLCRQFDIAVCRRVCGCLVCTPPQDGKK